MIDRRNFVGLGLVAGVGAVLRHARAEEIPVPPAPTGYAASPIHRAYPLEFRLDSDYRPDLSDRAASALVKAVYAFLETEHPDGMTMTFWDRHPSRMPFLPKHLESIVAHLFAGIAENLSVRPVDPIAVLALLYNESRFHPTVVSPAGAVGMAQFMPDTAREYGLTPTARADLWFAFREERAVYRQGRDERRAAFRSRHGGIGFSADAAIDRAVATGSLEVLREYRALRDEEDPSKKALQAYIDAIEEEFAKHDFFGEGREALEALDARVSYKVVPQTVRYLARSLDSFQGLASTAVASYNAGPEAVRVKDPRSLLHRFGDLPNYAETVKYVQRFFAVYSSIKYRLYEDERASETPPAPPPA